MNKLKGIKDIEELVPNELYRGYKELGDSRVCLMLERYSYKKDVLEGRKISLVTNMFQEEKQFPGCAHIDHLLEDQDSLFVVGVVPDYKLTDFLKDSHMDKKIKGALAYNLVDTVNQLHKNGIYHNNLSLERFSVYKDGSLCLFPNYAVDSDSFKFVQPSTANLVPTGMIVHDPSSRYFIDTFETAVLVDKVFNPEGRDYQGFNYSGRRETRRDIFKSLRNILNKNKMDDFTRPSSVARFVNNLSKKLNGFDDFAKRLTKKVDTNYLLASLAHYDYYSPRLRAAIASSFPKKEQIISSRSRFDVLKEIVKKR